MKGNSCFFNKKPTREKKKVHQFKKRAGFNDKHHLTPEQRGGKKIPSNLLNMDAYRHDAWHLLFGNRTLLEVINLLIRLKRAKKTQEVV